MNRLVGDLLDVVALEAEALRVKRQPHDAIQLMTEAVESYRPSFLAKGVQLVAELDANPINLDHDRILQVVANLLSNALKFTDRGGCHCSSPARAPSVRFSVIESGVGIAPGT